MQQKKNDFDSPEAIRIRNNARLDKISSNYKDRFHMATKPFSNIYEPKSLQDFDDHLSTLLNVDDSQSGLIRPPELPSKRGPHRKLMSDIEEKYGINNKSLFSKDGRR